MRTPATSTVMGAAKAVVLLALLQVARAGELPRPAAANATAAAAVKSKPRPPPFLPTTAWHRSSVLTFGDSLTESGVSMDGGWVSALTEWYRRRADVLHRGFAGYTSRQALQVLPEVLDALDANRTVLATLWFGTNDACDPKGPMSFMSVSIPEYQENIKTLVKKLKSAGVKNVLVLTPPPINDARRKLSYPNGPTDRRLDLARQYAAAAVEAGRAAGAYVLDVFTSLTSDPNWASKYIHPDGIHLSAGGQEEVYQLLNGFIWTNIQQARPDSLPYHHLTWEAIRYNASAPQYQLEKAAGPGGVFMPGVNVGPPAVNFTAAAAAVAGTQQAVKKAAGM